MMGKRAETKAEPGVGATNAPTGKKVLHYIHPDLRTRVVPVESLKLDPENTRLHNSKNLAAIEQSLNAHGQVLPLIVDGSGMVIVGNGRLSLIRERELAVVPGGKDKGRWTHVAVIKFQGSASEARALALRDNRTAELANWNFEALSASLRALKEAEFDLPSLGWLEHEYSPLLEGSFTPAPIQPLPTGVHGASHAHTVQLDDSQWKLLERCREAMTKGDGGRAKPGMAEVVEWLALQVLEGGAPPLKETEPKKPAPKRAAKPGSVE